MSPAAYDESNETVKKLVEVAIELFAEHGFNGTSIRDISRLTGMTAPSIYYYFGNKDGLILAILRRSASRFVGRLHGATERKDLEPLERFKLLLATHLDVVDVHRREAKIFFLDEERLSEEGNRTQRLFQTDVLNLYVQELQGLQSAGYMEHPDLKILALHILGVLNWHLRWYSSDGRLSLAQIKERAISFILHGALNRAAPQSTCL